MLPCVIGLDIQYPEMLLDAICNEITSEVGANVFQI